MLSFNIIITFILSCTSQDTGGSFHHNNIKEIIFKAQSCKPTFKAKSYKLSSSRTSETIGLKIKAIKLLE